MFAYRHFAAFAIIFDVHVFVVFAPAALIALVAETALLVDGAIGSPRFIVVGADFPSRFRFNGALGDADALRLALGIHLAHPSGPTVHLHAWI